MKGLADSGGATSRPRQVYRRWREAAARHPLRRIAEAGPEFAADLGGAWAMLALVLAIPLEASLWEVGGFPGRIAFVAAMPGSLVAALAIAPWAVRALRTARLLRRWGRPSPAESGSLRTIDWLALIPLFADNHILLQRLAHRRAMLAGAPAIPLPRLEVPPGIGSQFEDSQRAETRVTGVLMVLELAGLGVASLWLAANVATGPGERRAALGGVILLHLVSALAVAWGVRLRLRQRAMGKVHRVFLVSLPCWAAMPLPAPVVAVLGLLFDRTSIGIADETLVAQAFFARRETRRLPAMWGLERSLRTTLLKRPWSKRWKEAGQSLARYDPGLAARRAADLRLACAALALGDGLLLAGGMAAAGPAGGFAASGLALGAGLIVVVGLLAAVVRRLAIAARLLAPDPQGGLVAAERQFVPGYALTLGAIAGILGAGGRGAEGATVLAYGTALLVILAAIDLMLEVFLGTSGTMQPVRALAWFGATWVVVFVAAVAVRVGPVLGVAVFLMVALVLGRAWAFRRLGPWLILPFAWRDLSTSNLPSGRRAFLLGAAAALLVPGAAPALPWLQAGSPLRRALLGEGHTQEGSAG